MDTNRGPVYLLMDDLHHWLAGWARQRGFTLPSRASFDRLASECARALATAVGLPNRAVHVIGSDIIGDQVRALLDVHAPHLPIVCMDRLLAAVMPPGRWVSYHATRLVEYRDGAWQHAGDGPRPGHPPFAEQVAAVARQVGGRDVAIVDDGCFTGGSLLRAFEHLTAAGLRVRTAIVGVWRMAEDAAAVPFPVHAVLRYPSGHLLDWVDLRDFAFGCPEGGRVVASAGNGHAAASTPEHAVPYLHGFGDIEGWASIPRAAAPAFTDRALALVRECYAEIGAASEFPVRMRDLGRWPCDATGKPLRAHPDRPVVEVIAELQRSVCIPHAVRDGARA